MKNCRLLFLLLFAAVQPLFSAEEKLCDSLVESGAEVTKVASGFLFTEGPAVAADGRVFFTDQPNDRIYIWDENSGVSLFLEGCNRSNGLFFNRDGGLVSCADEKNELLLFDMEGTSTLLCSDFEDKHLNAPNDLWIAPNGGIYFTDPYYHRTWWSADHKEIQSTRGVYFLNQNGELSRQVADLKTPNGIVGTPDGKMLYVADIEAEKTWRYTILPDGSLADKQLFASVGSDGMTIDNRGNVYLTFGKVWVFNPAGKLICEIEFPEEPANICFGGAARNTLFVTARTSVYCLKMSVKGVD